MTATTSKSSVVHEATGVNQEVLLKDAKTLGIAGQPGNYLCDLSVYQLGAICGELQRHNPHPYPKKSNFTTYVAYGNGKVIAEKLTAEKVRALINIRKADGKTTLSEEVLDDVAYYAAKEAYETYEAMVRQTFIWGMFYIEDVLDNDKAHKAFNLAWDHGHSAGYAEVASYFSDYVELIK